MHNFIVIKLNYKIIISFVLFCFIICTFCSYMTPRIIAQNNDEIPLPVIMYHHISHDAKSHNDYVISPDELEQDFRYLKDAGYTAILPLELLKYKEGKCSLPKKPVIITFDDGFESVYHYAYPLALKYGMKFVVGIYGKETERFSNCNDHNILYSYMNLDEIKELSESGICEIANHTYNLHSLSSRKGVNIKANESLTSYSKTLIEDVSFLQNMLKEYEICPETFVYPYGYFCKESEDILEKMGFKITFSCTEGINFVNKNSSLKLLKRFNRPHGISSADFFKRIN